MKLLFNKTNIISNLSSFLFVFLMLFSFDVSSQTFECFTIRPPEKLLKNVKKIAILDFDGSGGRNIADYMIGYLLEEDRGIRAVGGGLFKSAKEGKTYLKGARTDVFEIVERAQLNKVLQEQNISNAGIINEQQAAEIGKVLGIDAIVTGSINYSYVDEKDKRKHKDKNDNIYYEYCTQRKVTAKGRLKIVSVNTAQILGTTDGASVRSQTKCDEERSGLASPSDIADNCYKDIAYKFVSYFCPTFQHTKYKFEKIRNKEFKKRAKGAANYIKRGDLDNAFPIFKAVYDADPYNAIAADAVGMLFDIAGNYEKAKEYWKIAAEIDPKEYKIKLDWVEKEMKTQQMMADLGFVIEPYEFQEKADALAKRVITKGRKSDRYKVFEKTKSGSKVVAKVPGSTEFVVLSEDGDFYKIKLLGGKEGFIEKNSVK